MARRKATTMNKNGAFFVVLQNEQEFYNEHADDGDGDYEMREMIDYKAGPFLDADTAVGWVRHCADSGALDYSDGTWCVVEKVFEFKVKQTVEEVDVRKTIKVTK